MLKSKPLKNKNKYYFFNFANALKDLKSSILIRDFVDFGPLFVLSLLSTIRKINFQGQSYKLNLTAV